MEVGISRMSLHRREKRVGEARAVEWVSSLPQLASVILLTHLSMGIHITRCVDRKHADLPV